MAKSMNYCEELNIWVLKEFLQQQQKEEESRADGVTEKNRTNRLCYAQICSTRLSGDMYCCHKVTDSQLALWETLLFILTINSRKPLMLMFLRLTTTATKCFNFQMESFSLEMKAACLDQNPSRAPDKMQQEISQSEPFMRGTKERKAAVSNAFL